jgi:hypothetical protein
VGLFLALPLVAWEGLAFLRSVAFLVLACDTPTFLTAKTPCFSRYTTTLGLSFIIFGPLLFGSFPLAPVSVLFVLTNASQENILSMAEIRRKAARDERAKRTAFMLNFRCLTFLFNGSSFSEMTLPK